MKALLIKVVYYREGLSNKIGKTDTSIFRFEQLDCIVLLKMNGSRIIDI